ncbi:MAG: zinc-ribbon domain-containing protein [Oscillospiraceae bacterium]|nr:zinc-ribbon domain-containing protein [Oscillospiraceae bacterium]
MKYCPNCGVAVEDGQRYCGECGAKLEFDPMPTEPVYTENERLKSDPVLNAAAQSPTPKSKKKKEKVPELTLEPDIWELGGAAAAAAKEPEKKEEKIPELTLEPEVWGKKAKAAEAAKAAEPAAPAEAAAAAAAAVAALPEKEPEIAQRADTRDYERADAEYHGPARDTREDDRRAEAEHDYERPDAEYHGPVRGTQGDYQRPKAERYDTLPNDYTMSRGQTPDMGDKKMPDETLMMIWSIVLTCLCSVCGIVGLVKTIKARKTMDNVMKYKLLSSAKTWLIAGTILHLLPFLANLL